MAHKWSIIAKRDKPAAKNKSRPLARIYGAGGRLRGFSCFFECLGVRITWFRKMGHVHLPNRRFRSERTLFLKIQLFRSEFAYFFLLDAKTPHFRAVFLLCIFFVNTFWSCWPDSNWWPHPYQEIFGVFYNHFRLFLVVSIPNNIVSRTFAKCSLRCFHACLWWNCGQPAICVDSACANRIDSAPQITPQFLRKSI